MNTQHINLSLWYNVRIIASARTWMRLFANVIVVVEGRFIDSDILKPHQHDLIIFTLLLQMISKYGLQCDIVITKIMTNIRLSCATMSPSTYSLASALTNIMVLLVRAAK